jgi:Cys-rich repeat protein
MSFNTLIRAYMEKVGEEQSQAARPGLLRRLAGSAAVGLGLGLLSFGCGSGDATSDDSALDEGKLDKNGNVKCTKNSTCKAGQFCDKKVTGPVVTPKYGITPTPQPTVKYGIMVPTTSGTGTCQTLPECSADTDCATGQICDGITDTSASCPPGAYCILPPTPETGICTVQCDTDKDCAKGEACVGATAGSSCPSGAYCILPPTPAKKGLCQVTVAPKYGINPTPTPTPKYGIPTK